MLFLQSSDDSEGKSHSQYDYEHRNEEARGQPLLPVCYKQRTGHHHNYFDEKYDSDYFQDGFEHTGFWYLKIGL